MCPLSVSLSLSRSVSQLGAQLNASRDAHVKKEKRCACYDQMRIRCKTETGALLSFSRTDCPAWLQPLGLGVDWQWVPLLVFTRIIE